MRSRITVGVAASLAASLILAGCGFSEDMLDEGADETTPTDPMICETKADFMPEPCAFGQTAIYVDTVRSGEVRLEITVGEPVEFDPSPEAHIVYDLPPGPVNVYFPVTIKNKSDDSVESVLILTQATNAQQGQYDGIQQISDGDIESFISIPAPGEEASSKHGWSMDTKDGIEYDLDIDGQSGYSVTFAEKGAGR